MCPYVCVARGALWRVDPFLLWHAKRCACDANGCNGHMMGPMQSSRRSQIPESHLQAWAHLNTALHKRLALLHTANMARASRHARQPFPMQLSHRFIHAPLLSAMTWAAEWWHSTARLILLQMWLLQPQHTPAAKEDLGPLLCQTLCNCLPNASGGRSD